MVPFPMTWLSFLLYSRICLHSVLLLSGRHCSCCTVKSLSLGTDRSELTVQTQIRLLPKGAVCSESTLFVVMSVGCGHIGTLQNQTVPFFRTVKAIILGVPIFRIFAEFLNVCIFYFVVDSQAA